MLSIRILILSLLLSVNGNAQSKYCGTWFSSSNYGASFMSFKRNGTVKWFGSGCTYSNKEKVGSWEIKDTCIVVYLEDDTLVYCKQKRRLKEVHEGQVYDYDGRKRVRRRTFLTGKLLLNRKWKMARFKRRLKI